MSLLSKIIKKNKGGLSRLAGRAAGIARVIPGVGTVASIGLGAASAALASGGGGGKLPPTFTGSGPGLDLGDLADLGRRLAPGGATGRGRVSPDATGRCPSGYHPAKDGRGCVRNRRMNFSNGRANGRAARRLKGAVKQFKKSFRMVTGKSPGKVIPKTRRK